jgi:hypothetical protein
LNDPRTSHDLSTILTSRPDRRWQAAALTGLAAVGDAAAKHQLLEILADDRHALAADAAMAVGLSGDGELLLPLAKLAQSRNRQIAHASLTAMNWFITDVRSAPRGLAAADLAKPDLNAGDRSEPNVDVPEQAKAAIVEAVTSLVLDAYVDPDIRYAALAVARRLHDQHYADLLTKLADQSELEGTPLLAVVQSERRRSREP